jgi:uncharacterized protein YbjQ (UPF0145 family)
VQSTSITELFHNRYEMRKFMELTTTPSMEGKKITRYCGVVAGEAVLGANILKDMFASVRDIVGGRSGTYEKELRKARQIALDELSEQARELGARVEGVRDI